ncbi:dual specificity protein kinase yak1 [Lithohypha guttulata]|nr:dual specificity protein kinase yak1 [Lithohypha guttulata]
MNVNMNNLHLTENQAQFRQASNLEAASNNLPYQASSLQEGFSYEPYQRAAQTTNLAAMNSNAGIPPQEYARNGETDVQMEDADPYNRSKYPSRPSHHNRLSQQFMQESSAAQRYSPMNISTSSASHISSPKSQQTSSFTYSIQSPSSRQSPTRAYSGDRFAEPPTPTRFNSQFLPSLQRSDVSPDSYFQPPSTSQTMSPATGVRTPGSTQSSQPRLGPVPRFRKVQSMGEITHSINQQPLYRRADPEGGFLSPLEALTTQLPATYRICNPNFKYESSRNPRRVLTKPSKGVKNDGYDNEDSDYILYVNDILGSEDAGHKNRYLILDVLGQGTFGQVVKCQNLRTQEVVAVKVIKNKTAYFNQSMMEVSVLDLLNQKLDKNDDHHLLRLKDTFIHKQHLCLVFELLSVNLYELIKQNQFRGLSTTLVRVFAQQLLNGLTLLNKARLIHCDLKPENILLKNLESPIIKIIDFGSACDERQTVYTYIQSRFYRSPEVLLGLPYSSAIDMWSLGCIVVELFLGLPLFPGSSEYNQVSRITEMLGLPPTWMLEMGKQSGEFFEKTTDEFGRRGYRLKSMEQYSREHNVKEQPSKKYFQATTLPDIIRSYSMPRKNMKQAEVEREMNNRVAFIDFVRGLLTTNPLERWTPQQAKLHPFITQQKFTQPFVPPMNLKNASGKPPAPGVQQQQQAEALSKQRAAQAAQAAQAQAAAAAAATQSAYAMQMNQYSQNAYPPQPPAYGNMHGGTPQGAPPPYPTSNYPPYPQGQIPGNQYGVQQSLYQQATQRAGRQRAATMDQGQGGIPPAIQRVASHLDPTQPIRLQPSPAYYPPPADVYMDSPSSNRRRNSRNQRNRDFIRTLEDGAMQQWQ